MSNSNHGLRLNRSVFRAVCIVTALVLVAFGAWKVIDRINDSREYSVGEHPTYTQEKPKTFIYNGEKYVLDPDIRTMLLIGIDKYEADIQDDYKYSRNQQQSDFLVVLYIDDEAKTFGMLQVNRDSMGSIPVLDVDGKNAGTVVGQLALSHTYGTGGKDSCENTVKAVSDYLYGIRLDHYVSFTMDAIVILNDSVGGVTVTINDDFTGVDDTLIKGETVTLYGVHAMNFVRSRMSMKDDPTNINRLARQREYLNALYSQAEKAFNENSDIIDDTFLKLTDYIVTDTTVNTLSSILDKLMGYEFLGIETIEGEAVSGEVFMEFYADEELLQKQIVRLFYKKAE